MIFKDLFFIFLAVSISSAHATELKTFHKIYRSIQEGNNIRMTIDFDQCVPKPPVENVLVYTAPTSIMLRKNYLQFANTPLTTNNPKFPNQPILENCTYKITEDNQVSVITRVITLPNYQVAHEMKSICGLGKAVRVFSK